MEETLTKKSRQEKRKEAKIKNKHQERIIALRASADITSESQVFVFKIL